jgi:hypothetical protein
LFPEDSHPVPPFLLPSCTTFVGRDAHLLRLSLGGDSVVPRRQTP